MEYNSVAMAWKQHMWYYLFSCRNMQEKLGPARLQVTMSIDKELLC